MIRALLYVTILVLLGGCAKKSNLPDLRERFLYKETKPFGTFAVHAVLEHVYDDKFIQEMTTSFSDKFLGSTDSSALYFSISRNYYPAEKDVFTLLDYVYQGNTAFIAASSIDTVLLSKLYCNLVSYEWLYRFNPRGYRNTSVRLIDGATTARDSFSYFYYPFANYFSSITNPDCRIVGYNEDNKPNLVVFFWGRGRLYLHSDPRAFSNYFLLTRNNIEYVRQVLQFLPDDPEHVYWDNYYNKINMRKSDTGSSSTLKAIFDYPALSAAFWIALGMLLLYILFNSKRRQRVIPVIKPVENTSIAFAKAIAGLYLQEKDNKSIADKMIVYFNEYVRSRFLLNISTGIDPGALSRKSGLPLEKTVALLQAITTINASEEIDDYQLLSLNEQIQEFHKTKP